MLPIEDPERRFALRIARSVLVEFLSRRAVPEYRAVAPSLQQHRATFVTLRRRDTGALRGCRGECRPSRPLLASIVRQTISSATDDPRFRPVTRDEAPMLSIRISALTPLKRVRPEDVVVGRHGLLIVQGRNSGLLLPEVPAHHGITTREAFLEALCRKAGLPADCVSESAAQLFAFEAESWGDDDPGVLADDEPRRR